MMAQKDDLRYTFEEVSLVKILVQGKLKFEMTAQKYGSKIK